MTDEAINERSPVYAIYRLIASFIMSDIADLVMIIMSDIAHIVFVHN